MTKTKEKTKEKDIICRSCKSEFDSKNDEIDLKESSVCPKCGQASLEVKVVETKVVNK